jgi:hypothetical protein
MVIQMFKFNCGRNKINLKSIKKVRTGKNQNLRRRHEVVKVKWIGFRNEKLSMCILAFFWAYELKNTDGTEIIDTIVITLLTQ